MRAALLRATGDPLDVRDDVELARSPGPGEVHIRVRATGLCGSDLSALRGNYAIRLPALLGHEVAGEVLDVGEGVEHVAVGDHVILDDFSSCGNCPQCKSGKAGHCAFIARHYKPKVYHRLAGQDVYSFNGIGGLAEELIFPGSGVVPIPRDVPFDEAAILGCGVMTGFGAALNAVSIEPGSTVIVFGCGGVGMSALQGARVRGASQIVAVDLAQEKLDLALKLGATHAVFPDDVAEVAQSVHGGIGFDYAFEVVGRSKNVRTAWESVRRGGTVIVLGLGPADDPWDLTSLEYVLGAKTLVGSMYGSGDARVDFPRMLDLRAQGQLDLASLITHRVGLDEINDAFAEVAAGNGMRAVVEMP